MTLATTLPALGLDLAATTVLTYGIYFRRHWRRDLLGAYVALNLGVFCAVRLLLTHDVGVGLGFGLFGILSIVRLRSSSIAQEEVGYYFVVLTLGLVNGLGAADLPIAAVLSAVLLGGMFVADHPRVARRVQRRTVVLDAAHTDDTALRADLERRLGGRVLHCLVSDVDFVAGTTKCDVRFRASEPGDGGYVAGPTNGHRQATTLTIVSHARTWSE